MSAVKLINPVTIDDDNSNLIYNILNLLNYPDNLLICKIESIGKFIDKVFWRNEEFRLYQKVSK